MSDLNDIEFGFPRQGWFRPGVIIAVSSLVLITAFLLPLSQKVLDVLWICSFCLSGAVAIICLMAQNSSDLIGFVPMVSGAVFLRLTTQASAAHHIIRDEPAGILLTWTGSTLASGFPLTAVFISLLLAVVSVFVVFAACQRITLASKGYLGQIYPLKRMGIETDLRLGVIDEEQAKGLARRVILESRFFEAINRTGLLMRAEVVICICILLICLIVPVLNSIINPSLDVGLLSAIARHVVALSVFMLIPSLIVAVTCGMLMGRGMLTLRTHEPELSAAKHVKEVTIVSLDSEGPEDEQFGSDLLLPKAGEYVVEFEPQTESVSAEQAPEIQDISCRNAKEYYEKLSRIICSVEEKLRVILLVSEKINSLPVTVPVNIAIRLSQKGQKVLLVDADPQRNAVANVFDLNPEVLKAKVVPSCLENLSVCSIPEDKLNRFLQKEKILSRFDTTLVYVPQIPSLKPSGEKALKPGAFYFIDDKTDAVDQRVVEQLGYCGWIGMVQSIQSMLGDRSSE